MNLDIEKIKAVLILVCSELSYLKAGVPASVLTLEAIGKTREALAALEAYDPDTIRRACAEVAVAFYTDQDIVFQKDIDFFNERIRSGLVAAIMNAGKE